MILVIGSTGVVGKEVVSQLVEARQPARILVRDLRKVAYLSGRVECIQGDLDHPETLFRPMQDIRRMFLVSMSTEQDENALAAAKSAGVEHIVKLSTQEAGRIPIVAHGHWHRERELAIEASGLAWTFLRPTMFMSNALQWAQTIRQQDAVFYPGGSGKIAPIHPADIASVAIAALTQSGHQGHAYELTGAELLSMQEMVKILANEIGRPLRYVDMPDGEAASFMRGMGLRQDTVDGLVECFREVRSGKFAYTTDRVEQVTLCRPRTFETWCREHTNEFSNEPTYAE